VCLLSVRRHRTQLGKHFLTGPECLTQCLVQGLNLGEAGAAIAAGSNIMLLSGTTNAICQLQVRPCRTIALLMSLEHHLVRTSECIQCRSYLFIPLSH